MIWGVDNFSPLCDEDWYGIAESKVGTDAKALYDIGKKTSIGNISDNQRDLLGVAERKAG
jgi:hypothetical protein